jgi:hypothetical protein
MVDDDRRLRYAQVLGAPRWNHASAHCACDVDDPDGRGFTTEICRRNYDRAVRERDQRLETLLAMVDAEVATASRPRPRIPSLVALRRRRVVRLPRLTLPRLRPTRPVMRRGLTPAWLASRG